MPTSNSPKVDDNVDKSTDVKSDSAKSDEINPATGKPWTYIVHEKKWIDDNGVQQSKPVRLREDEWPRYANENGL